MTSTTWEYLGEPGDPRRGRIRPALIGAVVAMLVVATAGGIWWSDHVRGSATDALTTAYTETQQVARAGEGSVLGTLRYASPMIGSTAVGEDVRAGLRALVQDSAAEVVVRLDALRATVADTTVLPWQPEQQQAQRALLALIDAETARFAAVAADARRIGTALGTGPASTAEARQALREAGAA